MELQTPTSALSFSMTAEKRALLLLVSLSFFLGLAFSQLYAVANSLFLLQYGSAALPVVYVAIAVVVPVFSYAFSRIQKRWSFPTVALVTMTFFTAMFVAAWLGLRYLGAEWLSFSLVVSFTLGGLLCGIVRGALAGFLFDARTLKQNYPLILAGEILGVVLGGLSTTVLVPLLGRAENVLLVAGSSMLAVVLLVARTTSAFRGALVQPRTRAQARRANISPVRLVRNPYIRLILIYQVLFSMGTRLVDYLFLQQARAHFTTPGELTRFIGTMMALATVLTFLFVLLLAGRVLTRYGMRLGLLGNSVGVAAVVAAVAVVGTIAGPGATAFFWLIVGAEFLHYILKSGLSDTSVRSTYQPLPPEERTACQTLVEGMGVPIAYGLSGSCLLLIRSVEVFQAIHVVYFTLALLGCWAAAGVVLRRKYGDKIGQSMRRRLFDSDDLFLKDRSSLLVAEAMLQSQEPKEVNHALEFLEKAEHPALDGRLASLVDHPSPQVRLHVLSCVERRQVAPALPAVWSCVRRERVPGIKAAAVRALCALKAGDVDDVLPYLDGAEPEVRTAALVGLFRYGGINGVLLAADRFRAMAASPSVDDKVCLARLVGEVGDRTFYQPLLPLLDHGSVDVRKEALAAAARVASPELWPAVMESLRDVRLRSMALAALRSAGDDLLPILGTALQRRDGRDTRITLGLIRACATARGGKVVDLLAGNFDHPDREVQHEILKALRTCGYRALRDRPMVVQALVGQIRESATILVAMRDLGDDVDVALLTGALQGELAAARSRIFLLLSFLYDARAVLGAEKKLVDSRPSQRGLALELLDVILSKDLKRPVFALLDGNLSRDRRLRELEGLFGLEGRSRAAWLKELATDTVRWPSNWVRSCSLYVAAKLGLRDVEEAAVAALDSPDDLVRETAMWALHTIDPERSAPHLRRLQVDENPRVAGMAVQLLG
jgi:HEAT repeat protein